MLNKILFVFLALLFTSLYAETKDPNQSIPRVFKQISPRLALLEIKRINKPHIIKTSAVIWSPDGKVVAALDPAVKDLQSLTVIYGQKRFKARMRIHDPRGFAIAQVDDNRFRDSINLIPVIQLSDKQGTFSDPRAIFFRQQYKVNPSGFGLNPTGFDHVNIVPNNIRMNFAAGSFSSVRGFQAMYSTTPIQPGYDEAQSGAIFDRFGGFVGFGSKLSRKRQDPQYFVSADDIEEAVGRVNAKGDSY